MTKPAFEQIWEEINKRSIYIAIINMIYLCLDIKLDIAHFNLTMEIYIKNDIDFDPMEILKDINKRNISFNNVLY